MSKLRVCGLILAIGLSACGGGGGDPGSSNFNPTPSTGGDTTGGGTTNPTTPTATANQASSITFVSATPAGTALAVRGAGGGGRTETGTLVFKVVSATGIPVNGATVTFTLNASSDATLSAASAVTGATGEATVTVQSGPSAIPVVVTAAVSGVTGVTTQSDAILISNDVAIVNGFELVAEKYNLNGGLTGDSTPLTIFVRDSNGNPVADGLAVSFTTDFGAVASSTLGGCTTVNGECSVDFRVQDPRGTGIATVTATALVQGATTLTDQIQINMASSAGYSAVRNDGTAVSPIALSSGASCSQTLELRIQDAVGRSVATGTSIAVLGPSTGVSPSVIQGGTVGDQLAAGFPPNRFLIQVSSTPILTGTPAVATACTAGTFFLTFTTPSGREFTQSVAVSSAAP